MVTMSTPFKDPKWGVYKLRKAIPEDIRPFFPNDRTGKPKAEYWQTLDTSDLKSTDMQTVIRHTINDLDWINGKASGISRYDN